MKNKPRGRPFAKGHPQYLFHHSEETKKKLSELHKGKSPSNKGVPMSEEQKIKISKANLGKVHSLETRKKMSQSKIGLYSGSKHWNWKGGLAKNKEHKKSWRNKWLEKNYDRKLMLNKKRRVSKRNAKGEHTLAEWNILKAQYNWMCPACKRKEPEIKLTEDHIIPLIKGGSDNIENIQPLCKSCNSHKYTKIIKYA